MKKKNAMITDYFTNYEDIIHNPGVEDAKQEPVYNDVSQNYWMRLFRSLNFIHLHHWIFLMLLGIITAIVTFCVEMIVTYIFDLRLKLVEQFGFHWTLSMLIWTAIILLLTAVAASIGQFVSHNAEGSGIPELKSILAGTTIYRYLSFRTLIGKIVGLIAALSAGLSVGKEGPFVHIAAGITNKLSKFRCFRDIYTNQSLKKQMLAASVAAGISATFGAPIGGVLYSIEVTSTYYMVSNLWKAFFCSCWAIFTFKILSVVGHVELFEPTKLVTLQLDFQYFAYALLGVLCALLGTFMIKVISQLIYYRAKLKLPYISNRWYYCLTVALVVALVSYPIDFLRLSDKNVLLEMFSEHSLEIKDKAHWNQPNVIYNLTIFVINKFILISFCYSLPIPAGIFIPTFVLGSVFGRLYGYILKKFFGAVINEAAYSIIGAASLTSSVSRAISVVMIILELSGELSYLIPVLVGVLISYALSNSIWISIYDVLIDMKNLPYLPAIRIDEDYSLKANNIMNRKYTFMCKDSKLSDIGKLLSQFHHKLLYKSISIPVVKSRQNQILLFSVELQSLRKYLIEHYNSVSHTFDAEAKQILGTHFDKLNSISLTDALDKSIDLSNISKFGQKLEISFRDGQKDKTSKDQEGQPIKEFYRGNLELKHDDVHDSSSDTQIDQFWNTYINWEHESIDINKAPFTLMEETPIAKIHFLFTMLSISQLFVINEGFCVGIITKKEFLKRRGLAALVDQSNMNIQNEFKFGASPGINKDDENAGEYKADGRDIKYREFEFGNKLFKSQ